jgi:membrane protein DedA with SNARE-associated domain
MTESAHELIIHYGYPGLFVLLMLGIVGLPVPDETLLTAAGFLIRKGDLHLLPTYAVSLLGSACGITLSFVLGRTLGFGLVHKYGRLFHVTEERLAHFHRWYQRKGRWGLTFGYFVPGVRHLVAIAAGTSGLSWPSFGLFAYSGAVLWIVTFLTTGYLVGEEWARASTQARRLIVFAFVVLLLGGLTFALLRRRQRRTDRHPPA